MSRVTCAIVVFTVAVVSASISSAKDDIEKARSGRVMWSAFQCSVYGEMSGNREEQARLFQIGLKAGRDFIEALKANQITVEAINNEVPVAVAMMLRGPTADFIIGRVFEAATSDAYDEIVKRRDGMPLQMSEWIGDEGAKRTKANTMFRSNNCLLIQ